MLYGNGLAEVDSYSLDYEIQRLLVQNGGTSLIDRTHARADALNLTGITDAVTPANNQVMSYAPTNRLASAAGAFGTQSWLYDGVGNRTQEISAGATNTYAYPATSNRLSGVTQGATSVRAFVYDANGNIATDTRSGALYAYTYNQNNRLKTVTVAGNLKATYTYDAMEHLAVRVLTNMTPSGTIHTVYDRDGNLLMESNGLTTGITREYIWLPQTQIAPVMGARASVARPLAVVDAVNTASPQTYWVSVDHLNRPAQMTNSAKASVWQATWQPFGAPQAITGTLTLDARFPGQWFQLESGLHQNWWRHYDPTTGRYTQVDPLGFPNGPSVYGYAGSNTADLTDLNGLCASGLARGAWADFCTGVTKFIPPLRKFAAVCAIVLAGEELPEPPPLPQKPPAPTAKADSNPWTNTTPGATAVWPGPRPRFWALAAAL